MSIRVLVNGARGKMGQATVKAIESNPAFTLVGQTGRTDDLAAMIKQSNAEVVVDFTNADVAFKNAMTIIDAGAHPVIGTSGIVANEIKTLQERCAKARLGGIIAPNFSLGAVLLMKYSQEIAKYFPSVEIIEMHHDGKLDSPSGTAIRTAELISETRKKADSAKKVTREIITGSRGALHQDIHIHALRLPGLVAQQQVIFGGTGETLTIRHDSIDRVSFMPGVCLAAQKVLELDKLVVGLEHIL